MAAMKDRDRKIPDEVDRESARKLDDPYGHQSLISSQWADFAAFAWKGYQAEGRGAVVLDLRNATRLRGTLNVPTYYVAEGSEALRKQGGWPGDEISEVVATYDPQLDVVFVVLRLDGDCFYYNASDEPTPPDAHRHRYR
jgi:hypothetical protein